MGRRLTGSSGDVTVTGTTGPVRVRTGAVTVPGTGAYRVTVGTSSGDSEVGVRQDSTAGHAIAVRTTLGDVRISYGP